MLDVTPYPTTNSEWACGTNIVHDGAAPDEKIGSIGLFHRIHE